MRSSFCDEAAQCRPRHDPDGCGHDDAYERLHRHGVADEDRDCEHEGHEQPLAVERCGGAEGEEEEVARANESEHELHTSDVARQCIDDDDGGQEQQGVEDRPHEQHRR
jgi:hypothetical protein